MIQIKAVLIKTDRGRIMTMWLLTSRRGAGILMVVVVTVDKAVANRGTSNRAVVSVAASAVDMGLRGIMFFFIRAVVGRRGHGRIFRAFPV
jgi:hypothetical protein